MYKTLLIFKYLRRKLAPLFAAVAVMLCTAMVIIVMSVMGGFLEQFRLAAQKLTGDVIVQGPTQGFVGYEDLMAGIGELPEVEVVTPMIKAVGLIRIGQESQPVLMQGVDFVAFDKIVNYRDTLLWPPEELVERMGLPGNQLGEGVRQQMMRDHPIDPGPAPGSPERDSAGTGLPEILIGVEVNPYQRRDDEGNYDLAYTWAGAKSVLTTLPITDGGVIAREAENREVLVVNEFKSGLYDVDTRAVFVPFATLQKMLKMEPRQVIDPATFDPATGKGDEVTRPGRATHLMIKATPGVTVEAARDAVQRVVADYYADKDTLFLPWVKTWKDEHGQIIGAVEKEKNLVSFLFGVISLVAIFMVATTFYTLIQDKTRDIGILRAIGATRLGILTLFLGYGLAIGVLGAGSGAALGIVVVHSLNSVQYFLGHYLGVATLLTVAVLVGVLLGLTLAIIIGFRQRRILFWIKRLPLAGALLLIVPAIASLYLVDGWASGLNGTIQFVMWDPQTYMFDRIPDRLNPTEITLVSLGMIVSCVVGSLIPALVASSLNPVETLRYE